MGLSYIQIVNDNIASFHFKRSFCRYIQSFELFGYYKNVKEIIIDEDFENSLYESFVIDHYPNLAIIEIGKNSLKSSQALRISHNEKLHSIIVKGGRDEMDSSGSFSQTKSLILDSITRIIIFYCCISSYSRKCSYWKLVIL